MATAAKKTIGISQQIEAEATGAVANFHKITHYAVDLITRNVGVTLMGYVSQQKAQEGKQALINVNMTVPLQADEVPTEELLYQKIIAVPTNDATVPVAQNYFSGATLVTE